MLICNDGTRNDICSEIRAYVGQKLSVRQTPAAVAGPAGASKNTPRQEAEAVVATGSGTEDEGGDDEKTPPPPGLGWRLTDRGNGSESDTDSVLAVIMNGSAAAERTSR